MVVYVTTDNKLYFYNGTIWTTIDTQQGLTLPYSGTGNSLTPLFDLNNTNTAGQGIQVTLPTAGIGVKANVGNGGIGVHGESLGDGLNTNGIKGFNDGNGVGVYGGNIGFGYGGYFDSPDGTALYANSTSGKGIEVLTGPREAIIAQNNSASETTTEFTNLNANGFALKLYGKVQLQTPNAGQIGAFLKNMGNGTAEWASPYVYSYTNPTSLVNFTNHFGTAMEASTGAASNGSAVRGVATNNSQTLGGANGISGVNFSTNFSGAGVYGVHNGHGKGVLGVAIGNQGAGIRGFSEVGFGGSFESITGTALQTTGKIQLGGTAVTPAKNRALVAIDNDGNAKWDDAVAFNTVLNSYTDISAGTSLTLNFPAQYTQNINYSASTGEVTIESDGIYHFDVNLNFLSTYSNMNLICYINNDPRKSWVKNSSSSDSFSCSFDQRLYANDKIKFTLFNNSSVLETIATTHSYCNGHLIR